MDYVVCPYPDAVGNVIGRHTPSKFRKEADSTAYACPADLPYTCCILFMVCKF